MDASLTAGGFNADDAIGRIAGVTRIVEQDELAVQTSICGERRRGGDDVRFIVGGGDGAFPTVALGLDAPAEALEFLCANERKREQFSVLELRVNEAAGQGKVAGTPHRIVSAGIYEVGRAVAPSNLERHGWNVPGRMDWSQRGNRSE